MIMHWSRMHCGIFMITTCTRLESSCRCCSKGCSLPSSRSWWTSSTTPAIFRGTSHLVHSAKPRSLEEDKSQTPRVDDWDDSDANSKATVAKLCLYASSLESQLICQTCRFSCLCCPHQIPFHLYPGGRGFWNTCLLDNLRGLWSLWKAHIMHLALRSTGDEICVQIVIPATPLASSCLWVIWGTYRCCIESNPRVHEGVLAPIQNDDDAAHVF